MSAASNELISVDPERLGGQPVFKGTRVPVRSLFEHLNEGDGLEIFPEDFPASPESMPKRSSNSPRGDGWTACRDDIPNDLSPAL